MNNQIIIIRAMHLCKLYDLLDIYKNLTLVASIINMV